ncbi:MULTISPECIES: lytic polysaccharide monooxygenase [Actinoalloteichus]|uniref:Chitin binding domain n=1 Tax=Actinoalloteichus fjordicus TaxID=1612552 RepID=A0AAC9LAV6_9PSEU|nr:MULTISPECIES: lytic polysaccharide monooxygenase [Actinoalloteichus]APU14217.1 Chitin binding domain [Actinoalloteichus fjordicus]APU20186.1 Chitin binding domain [Actinoalloteichus sp. GBA129-24]
MTRRRKGALIGVLAGVVGLLAALLPASSALAHGGMSSPGTRTYFCFEEGPENPQSEACTDAIAEGGTQPLYDWFGILISDAAGRHQELIPDGQLCGAGTDKYAAYDVPRDWQTTTLPTSGEWTFEYVAWAPHPGDFDLYVTKDGFDPSSPLTWSDLEPEPFSTVTDPPIVDGSYQWTAELPEGKSGQHIIYSIWQRSDSPEAFYNCSDVVFGG